MDTEAQAKFNESLIIDKHYQNLLQVNAFLKNVQKQVYERSVLIEGDYENETTRDEEFVYDNITNQTHQNLKANKFHPSRRYEPSHFLPGLFHWLPPGLLGFKEPSPPLVIPRPSSPNLITLFPVQNPGQRPGLPYPGPMHSMSPTLPPSFRPPGPYLPTPSYTPGPTRPKRLSFLYANQYLQKNPYLINPLHSTIPPPIFDPAESSKTSTISHNAKIWLDEIAPYTPVNEKFKKPSKNQSSPHHSANTAVPTDSLPHITVQKPLSPLSKQRYLDLMELLDEGYMMVFMIELCRKIAVKDRQEVRQVVYHTEMIYNSLWNNGRLAWIGDPLETVIWKLSIILSGRNIDLVRTFASMMFHMLLQRKQTLSAEVNSIIDEADLFYNDDEGDRLLYFLKQFEDYPKTTNNSYWLCDNLIESFLLPFRRLSSTRRRQRLIDSINKALKQRFPLLLKEHHGGTLAGKASPKNGSRPKTRKRKRHHLPHKKKRKRKRYHTPEYNIRNINGKQFSQVIENVSLLLRTETPVTSDQPRLRATARKSYRKKRRPTTAYFNLY